MESNTPNEKKEEVVMTSATPITSSTEKKPGRPADPNSKRQQRLNDIQKRKEEGVLKLGRPKVEGSKRQQELEAKLARAASGEPVKKGRPKMTEEQKKEWREKREAEQAAILAKSGKLPVAKIEVEAEPEAEAIIEIVAIEPEASTDETAPFVVEEETPIVEAITEAGEVDLKVVEEAKPKRTRKKDKVTSASAPQEEDNTDV